MTGLTRRGMLGGVAAATAAIAGCSSSETGEKTRDTQTPQPTTEEPSQNPPEDDVNIDQRPRSQIQVNAENRLTEHSHILTADVSIGDSQTFITYESDASRQSELTETIGRIITVYANIISEDPNAGSAFVIIQNPSGGEEGTFSIQSRLAAAYNSERISGAEYSTRVLRTVEDTSNVDEPTEEDTPTQDTNDATDGSEDETNKPLEIIEHNLVIENKGEINEQLYVRGRANNTKGEELSYAEIEVSFYNESGNLIDSSFTNINGIEAGGTWEFEVMYIGNKTDEIESYEVEVGEIASY